MILIKNELMGMKKLRCTIGIVVCFLILLRIIIAKFKTRKKESNIKNKEEEISYKEVNRAKVNNKVKANPPVKPEIPPKPLVKPVIKQIKRPVSSPETVPAFKPRQKVSFPATKQFEEAPLFKCDEMVLKTSYDLFKFEANDFLRTIKHKVVPQEATPTLRHYSRCCYRLGTDLGDVLYFFILVSHADLQGDTHKQNTYKKLVLLYIGKILKTSALNDLLLPELESSSSFSDCSCFSEDSVPLSSRNKYKLVGVHPQTHEGHMISHQPSPNKESIEFWEAQDLSQGKDSLTPKEGSSPSESFPKKESLSVDPQCSTRFYGTYSPLEIHPKTESLYIEPALLADSFSPKGPINSKLISSKCICSKCTYSKQNPLPSLLSHDPLISHDPWTSPDPMIIPLPKNPPTDPNRLFSTFDFLLHELSPILSSFPKDNFNLGRHSLNVLACFFLRLEDSLDEHEKAFLLEIYRTFFLYLKFSLDMKHFQLPNKPFETYTV